jgi:enamine deaminase RidA (YjgF/YER057c/UK114 family)
VRRPRRRQRARPRGKASIHRTIAIIGTTVLLGVTAAPQQLQRINPPALGTPQTYTHVVKAGKIVFIAGQMGTSADGKLAGSTMTAQLEQVLKNLAAALQSQGLDFNHVAKVTIFTTDIAAFRAPDAAAIRGKYFGDARPASTLVQVVQLATPEFKVEIEAIAVAP